MSLFERLLKPETRKEAAEVLTGPKTSSVVTMFHDHLDKCSQCREHPMSLCSTGAELLKNAATTSK